tara:strand:+ start:823 stop:1011 length:189 start_codon:yes stop_codon:yes gene_type:complete
MQVQRLLLNTDLAKPLTQGSAIKEQQGTTGSLIISRRTIKHNNTINACKTSIQVVQPKNIQY